MSGKICIAFLSKRASLRETLLSSAICYESNRQIYDSFTVYDIPKFICAYLLTVHNVLNLILITLVNVSYIKIIFPVYLLKRANQGSCGVNCLIFNL
jgi:hypothetical protein